MAYLTDIGANLAHSSFDADREAVLLRAAQTGVGTILVTGSCTESSQAAARMAAREAPVALYATAGMHPHYAKDCDEETLRLFRELGRNKKVVAIGETGLDYCRNFSPAPTQQAAFAAHIDIAADLQLPMFLHQRDAHADFLSILQPQLPKLSGAVVHCFTGTEAELEAYLDLDLYVGITGWICDERRGHHLQEFIHKIPDDRILIETDAPYLLPRSISPRPRSRRNEPMWLAEVASTVARCRNQDMVELAHLSTANAARLFGLPPA